MQPSQQQQQQVPPPYPPKLAHGVPPMADGHPVRVPGPLQAQYVAPPQQQQHVPHPLHPSAHPLAPAPPTPQPQSSSMAVASRQSERVLLSTASMMAQRSYNEGNYAMAKRLLDSISISYRHEGWKSILTTILLTSLDCAVRLRHTHDAIVYSLELMGANLLVTPTQKVQIMQQMMALATGPPVAPLQLADAAQQQQGAGQSLVSSGAPFDVQHHVFDVDRRHGILSATSHFLTVPESAEPALADPSGSGGVVAPVSNQRDPFVCVQEEFDLVLTLAVGFPVPTDFTRLDVYFYAPQNVSTPSGMQIQVIGPHGTAGTAAAAAAAATPYHLVLLPGGASTPIQTAGSGPVSDRDLPVLRPDSLGHVRADLSFPGVAGLVAAATPSKGASVAAAGGASAFTFSFGQPAPMTPLTVGARAGDLRPQQQGAQSSRSFRVRMKATAATTSQSATLGLPLASPAPSPAAAAALASVMTPGGGGAGAPSSLHIPGANQALFVTTVVASLAVPPPSEGNAITVSHPQQQQPQQPQQRALQLKLDVMPSKHEETFTPLVLLEAQETERRELEKKARKKGSVLPPLEDVSLDPTVPARTPTLRILPQHARAHLALLHPSPALIGEFYPLQVRVCSDGDEINGGELAMFAAAPVAGSNPAPSPSNATLTPSPSPGAGTTPALTPSASADGLNALKNAGAATTDDHTSGTAVAHTDQPPRSASNSLSVIGGGAAGGGGGADVAPETVRFYRLAPGAEGLVGRPGAGILADSLFEELPAGSSLAVPSLSPGSSHCFTIFLRTLAPTTPTLSFTLSYTSRTGVALSVTSALTNLAFKPPFKIKCKIFSDALSGLASAPAPAPAPGAAAAGAPGGAVPPAPSVLVSSSQAQRLILHQAVLLHVELENISGAVLRLDELGLELSGKFFRNMSRLVPGSSVNHVLHSCVSPAAAAAIQEAAKVQSHGGDASDGASPSICVAPGEKYTHLFTFVPIVPGKTRYTPLHVRWNRIVPILAPPAPVAPGAIAPHQRRGSDGDAPSNGADPSPAAVAAAAAAALAGGGPPVPPPSLVYPTPSVAFKKDLLYFHILKAPLAVTLDFPASSPFGSTFDYVLRIANATDQMHDVEMAVLDPDGGSGAGASAAGAGGAAAAGGQTASQTGHASLIKCVLSGKTRGLLRIRPHSVCTVSYRVCPLECGSIALPRIQLKAAGLTTLANAGAHHAAGATTAPSAAAPAHSILLMDPSDVGVVFVHPKAKHDPTMGPAHAS